MTPMTLRWLKNIRFFISLKLNYNSCYSTLITSASFAASKVFLLQFSLLKMIEKCTYGRKKNMSAQHLYLLHDSPCGYKLLGLSHDEVSFGNSGTKLVTDCKSLRKGTIGNLIDKINDSACDWQTYKCINAGCEQTSMQNSIYILLRCKTNTDNKPVWVYFSWDFHLFSIIKD